MDKIQQEIRKRPLGNRLKKSIEMISAMCSNERPPKKSVPVQPTDEDVFVTTTLLDAIDLIESIGCRADSDGDCEWSGCPQKCGYKPICLLYVDYEED